MSEILALAEGQILVAALVFVRLGAVIALMPGVGEAIVPARVKLALSLLLTAALTPIVAASAPVQPTALPLAILSEAVIGLGLGLMFRLMIVALNIAAVIIAQSTSLAQMFPGIAGEASTASANLMSYVALALFLAGGFHVKIVESLIAFYDLVPLGAQAPLRDLAHGFVSAVSRTTSTAFSLAAGFVVVSLIYNFGIGLANRAMPQLMLTMIAAPALSIIAFLFLGHSLPQILTAWGDTLALIATPFK